MAESNKKKQLIKKALIEALTANLGNATKACAAVGIARKTYYEYLKEDDFKAEVESIEDSNLDFAESKLRELINGVTLATEGEEPIIYKTAPNVTATIFYLKTKGKKRGYIEKQEIEHFGVFEWSQVSKDAQSKKNLTDD
jgi:hypothetical protein